METTLTAIELTGMIDENRQLRLDSQLPIGGPMAVRVIVLYPTGDEFDELKWLEAAAANPAFDFLNDPAEDIYTLADGKPVQDEI
jgi:hypothetical protein